VKIQIICNHIFYLASACTSCRTRHRLTNSVRPSGRHDYNHLYCIWTNAHVDQRFWSSGRGITLVLWAHQH